MIKRVLKKVKKIYIIITNAISILKSYIKIEKMKNHHDNERCFIIGNGPSLKVEDLEKLRAETTFSTNRIYNIYEKTDWRSTYYCVQDHAVIETSKSDIAQMPICSTAFVAKSMRFQYPKFRDVLSIRLRRKDFYPEPPMFSDNIHDCVYEGSTVTYMCLQIAMYMGFKEIYLLGIDHSYAVTLEPDGNISHFEGISNHFSEKDVMNNIPALYKTTLAYETAKKYADERGVKIYNATRGGKLEVFERVDFDALEF